MKNYIDLPALKSNPPKGNAIKNAINGLATIYFPGNFPKLNSQDHLDMANATMEWVMDHIDTIKFVTRILIEADGKAHELIEERTKNPIVSLNALTAAKSSDSEGYAKTLAEADQAAWNEAEEKADMLERFEFAMTVVLKKLRQKDQKIVLAYWNYLRDEPDGTDREFGKKLGLAEGHVHVIMKRLEDKVEKIMGKSSAKQ